MTANMLSIGNYLGEFPSILLLVAVVGGILLLYYALKHNHAVKG
jgi:hypothetical protein